MYIIKGVIGRVISNQPSARRDADLKLQARLPLNCTTPISNGNRTEWSSIRSVILRVITKSDDRTAGV